MDLENLSKNLIKASKASFTATDDMKKAKSKLWASFEAENGPSPCPSPDLAQALRFGAIDKKWWDEPGFPAWLWNRNEFDERLEYIGILALEELESTLKSKLVTSAQKIPAIKLALEVSRKLGKADVGEISLDDKLSRMSRSELEEYIASRVPKIVSNDPK